MDLFNTFFEEPNIESLDISKIGFKVHASLIYKLGEELITDEITALSELVKNSYDADSPYVNLNVDPFYREDMEESINGNVTKKTLYGVIVIKDEGHGMNKSDIVNGWLTISNSYKKKMKKNKEVTDKYNRMPLGDKGLGRLSVQKLGNYMTLKTKKEGSLIEYTVDIPWGHFRRNTTIDNVPVSCTEFKVSIEEKDKGYTELIIKDLVNPELWSNLENIQKLEKELSQIISPFKTSDKTFYIYAKVGQKELNFNKISDEALNGAISKYSFRLVGNRLLVQGYYIMEFFDGKHEIALNHDNITEFFNLKNEQLIGCKLIGNSNYCIHFSQLINLKNIGGLKINKDTNALFHPGNFSGEVYSYTLDSEFIKSQISKLNFKMLGDLNKFRSYISNNKGIKIFRDDFTILPYGYGDKGDWLALSADAVSKGKFTDLKNENVIGYIQLPGKKSYNLREKTNREGLIEDEYYQNFEVISKFIIKRININRQKLKEQFNDYIKEISLGMEHNDTILSSYEQAVSTAKKVTDKSNDVSISIQKAQKRINDSMNVLRFVEETVATSDLGISEKKSISNYLNEIDSIVNTTKQTLSDATKYLEELHYLKKQFDVIEGDYSVLIDRMEDITELAGLGIVAETLTHELHTLVNNTKKNTDEIASYFKEKYGEEKKISRYFNFVKYSAEAMRKEISHLSPGFRNVRSLKKQILISEVIQEHIEHYSDRAKRYKIIMNIFNVQKDFEVNLSLGLMYQVFDNIYNNSEHWLQHAIKLGEINEGEYNIDLRGNGIFHIWDNGIGIDKSIENQIFEPFITNKHNGRGLGLYIISKILHAQKCTIRLVRERNQHNNLYKFEIDLSNTLSNHKREV